VQFLLQLNDVGATTTWVTRRPVTFERRAFDLEWDREVEQSVGARVAAGLPPHITTPRSTTGPRRTPRPWTHSLTPECERGIDAGILVSREMFDEITPDGVRFADGSEVAADPILWATGFLPRSTTWRVSTSASPEATSSWTARPL